MAINSRLEADGRRGISFEPARGARPYLAIIRPVSRPGGAPSSSQLLEGGTRVEDPGTKLGELPQLHDTDATSTPDRQSVPPATVRTPSGFDPEQKPSSGHF